MDNVWDALVVGGNYVGFFFLSRWANKVRLRFLEGKDNT